VKELIERYKTSSATKRRIWRIIAITYSILKGFIGILCRSAEGKPVGGDSSLESLLIAMILIYIIFVYIKTVPIMMYGTLDVERLNYMLTQMALMLSPRKLSHLDA
jgi:hypothetical protein